MSISKGGRGGTIINMASICGLDSFAIGPAYCASKHGVVGFTKSLADKDLESELGIKFILICPSFTDTTLIQNTQSLLYGQNVDSQLTQLVDKYGIQTYVQISAKKIKKKYYKERFTFLCFSVDECAKSIVDVILKPENGSAWILSKGVCEKVNFHLYFKKD